MLAGHQASVGFGAQYVYNIRRQGMQDGGIGVCWVGAGNLFLLIFCVCAQKQSAAALSSAITCCVHTASQVDVSECKCMHTCVAAGQPSSTVHVLGYCVWYWGFITACSRHSHVGRQLCQVDVCVGRCPWGAVCFATTCQLLLAMGLQAKWPWVRLYPNVAAGGLSVSQLVSCVGLQWCITQPRQPRLPLDKWCGETLCSMMPTTACAHSREACQVHLCEPHSCFCRLAGLGQLLHTGCSLSQQPMQLSSGRNMCVRGSAMLWRVCMSVQTCHAYTLQCCNTSV
jgi:hypothetical protein